MALAFADIAFTPTVRKQQERLGSARGYDRFLAEESPSKDRLTAHETGFIEARDGFYQATVSETGWPYVQFRGGPAGFLKVLDEKTIAYVDFRGNRQYVSLGNLTGDNRVALILMDYPNRRRLKILGRARTVDLAEDPDLVGRLAVPGYKGRPERAVLITVDGFDWNCPQHIPQRFTTAELDAELLPVREEIARLRAENAALRARLAVLTVNGTD
jgi:predicted pyridoxine 5'-phosphate oxidase superfamily flavin-nucleotide-binding protein